MNCEGVRGDENVFKMLHVKDVVRKEKDEGLKIMIGGDMNAHISSILIYNFLRNLREGDSC